MMWVEELRAFTFTFVFASACFGAGYWITWLCPESFSFLDRLALNLIGGFGVLGTIFFAVGQIAYTRWSIASILVIAIAAGFSALRHGPGESRTTRAWRIANPPFFPAAIILFVLVVTASGGLAPITGDWNSDAIAYHLLGPKVWLREGIVRPVADNSHTAFPAIVECNYGSLMAFGGPSAPGFSATLTFAAFLLLVAGLARRAGLDSKSCWWAAAIVAIMPAVYAGAHSAFVDVIYASFVLGAARIAFDAKNGREFLAAGIFCGFSIGTKYTGLVATPLLLVCMLIPLAPLPAAQLCDHFRWRSAAKFMGILCAAAAAVAAPFYLRNWIALGSPIYPPPPVLYRFVHVKYLSAEAIRDFHTYMYGRGRGLGRSFTSYLLLPFRLTYETSFFHGGGGIGLMPLALGPLGLMGARRDAFLQKLVLLAFLLMTAWFLTDQESRFLIDVYTIAAILSVLGWQYATKTAPDWGPALAAVVMLCSVLYGGAMIVRTRMPDMRAALSSNYAAQRRKKTIPFVEGFDYLNTAPGIRRVLILDPSVPPYYLEEPYIKPFGQWGEQTLPGGPNLQEVLLQIHSLGVSHLLDVRTSGSDFCVPERQPGLNLVFSESDVRVYAVE